MRPLNNLILVLAVVLLASGCVSQSPAEYQNLPPPGTPPQEKPVEEGVGEEFMLPSFDASMPLPKAPEGQWVKKQLGDVEISYFSTSIIRGMTESGADFFITLKNNGSSEATVDFSPVQELQKDVPSWNLHFYSLQDPPVKIAAGGEKKLWYFASLDKSTGQFTVNFKLWLGNNESAIASVVFGSAEEDFRGKETSVIYGYVKDESGKPVSNARIDAMMNCGRFGFRGDSDEQGRYMIRVMGMEDIDALYGTRELACDSYDYYISITKDGYEHYFNDHVAPTRKDFARIDIVLERKKEDVSYSLKWEKKVDDSYGFFWVKPSDDWSVFSATQAKHPPELGKPTNFYLFDSQGNVLWKQPTENECWGIDIAGDGSKVVAGCHDGKVYTVDRSGKLLWSFDEGGMIRSACLSRDGKKILSGAIRKLYLFDAESGAKTEVPWIDEWFRNCVFYRDDSGFVVGSRTVAAFDSKTNKLWQFVIGEFPMFLGADQNKNVFAAGKSRTIFSFDADGNLRWKHRIPDHVVTAGAATPDGSKIALGTVGGMVYLFDGSGSLLWKRATMVVGEHGTVGHNAVAISADGKRIAVGTAPANCVIVYNERGTTMWKGCVEPEKISNDLMVGVTNVQISGDANKIIAAYGDNYIREFVRNG